MRSDKASWINRVETVVDHDHLVWRYLVLWVVRDREVSSGKFASNTTIYFHRVFGWGKQTRGACDRVRDVMSCVVLRVRLWMWIIFFVTSSYVICLLRGHSMRRAQSRARRRVKSQVRRILPCSIPCREWSLFHTPQQQVQYFALSCDTYLDVSEIFLGNRGTFVLSKHRNGVLRVHVLRMFSKHALER